MSPKNQQIQKEHQEAKNDSFKNTNYAVDIKEYKNLIYNLPIGILLIGANTEILINNQKALELLGLTEEQLIGKSIRDSDWNIIHEDGSQFPNDTFPVLMSISTKRPITNVVMGVYQAKFKNRIWIEVNAYPKLDKEGKILNVICTFQDITYWKRKNEELKITRFSFNNVDDGIFRISSDGRFMDVNHTACEMLGYGREEIIGRPVGEISPDWTPKKWTKHFENLKANKTMKYESILYNKNGTQLIVDVRSNYCTYFEEEFNLAIVRDISHQKQVDIELLNEKYRLQYILEGTHAGTWEWDILSGEVIFNKRWAEILGYTLEEISPGHIDIWKKNAHPEDLKTSDDQLNKHFRGELEYYQCEVRMKHKNGDWIWIVDRGKVYMWDENGNPWKMAGTHIDITERKKAENEQNYALSKWQSLIASSINLIAILNKNGEFIYINKIIPGLEMKEVLKNRVFDYIAPEYHNMVQEQLNSVFNEGKVAKYEIKGIGIDGITDSWYETYLSPIIINEEVVHVTQMSIDITERKKREQKLTQLSQAVEQSHASIVITDTEGKIIYVNEKCIQITGYSQEELIGKKPRLLKSGYTSKAEYALLWSNLKSGKEWRGLFHNKKKNGELYWESAIISPLTNQDGKITHYLAVKEDINKLTLAEEKLKERNIELLKTNNELDRFVYSTSHELRSPLTSILGLYSLLNLNEFKNENKKILELINRSIFRMDATLRDILNYSRNARNDIQMEKIDINGLIENAFGNLDFIDPKLIYKKMVFVKGNNDFYSDLGRVKVIINNLIGNAIKYSKKNIKDSYIQVTADISSEKLILEIQDNGIGIDAEYLPEIFSMFYRATTESSGSGLGLYIVKECIEKLNARIYVSSEINIGTKFIIKIPNTKP